MQEEDFRAETTESLTPTLTLHPATQLVTAEDRL